MNRNRLFASSALLFTTFGGGYYVGQTITAKKVQVKLKDQQHALRVVLENQPTWRTHYHQINNAQSFERKGAFISIFQPRFTGCIVYVVFHNTKDGKTYLLQTVQDRVVDGKEKRVAETPAGFYNGEYFSPDAHVVTEDAERTIERAFNLKKPITANSAYADAMERFKNNKLPQDEYTQDKNLWETADREAHEEAGIAIPELEKDANYKVVRSLLDEIDSPKAYVSIRLVTISGSEMPKLAKLVGDEVVTAEFVPLENFDLKTKKVSMSTGVFEIKPFVLDSTASLVEKLRAANNPSSRNMPRLGY